MDRWISHLTLATLLLQLWAISAQAQRYEVTPEGGDLIGQVQTITIDEQETLADVARQHKIGHQEIRLANPEVEFWLLAPDTEILLPKRFILPTANREGIVLNVPEMRLYYFPEPCSGVTACPVFTYPVSIGRMDWKTPLGTTRITAKVPNPSWIPPESIREEAEADGRTLPPVVPPGPDNPLGAYALHLALESYRIHGTNRPYGVGMRVTHGCVRLYPEDIESLFAQVEVGTRVQIVDQPVKFGWVDGTLFMEVHPPLEEDAEGIATLKDKALRHLEEIWQQRPFILNGREFLRALDEQRGVPIPVSRGNLGK